MAAVVDGEFTTYVSLSATVRVRGAEARRPLVIALHGRGMTDYLFERALRPGMDRGGLSWWFPRGILPCEVGRGRIAYAWYVFNGDQAALRASMDQARAYVRDLVHLARRTLRPSHVTLLGFSQGAYLASYVALSSPGLVERLVCCSGRPKAEFVADLGAVRGLKVLVQTGTRDQAVPADLIAKGVAPLREAGLDVTEMSYDAAHEVTREMAVDAAEFAS